MSTYSQGYDGAAAALAGDTENFVIQGITLTAGETIALGAAVSIFRTDNSKVVNSNSGVATDRIFTGIALDAATVGLPVRIIKEGRCVFVDCAVGVAAGAALYTTAVDGKVDDAAVAGSAVVGWALSDEITGHCAVWVHGSAAAT